MRSRERLLIGVERCSSARLENFCLRLFLNSTGGLPKLTYFRVDTKICVVYSKNFGDQNGNHSDLGIRSKVGVETSTTCTTCTTQICVDDTNLLRRFFGLNKKNKSTQFFFVSTHIFVLCQFWKSSNENSTALATGRLER